jgi:hypothetical protein
VKPGGRHKSIQIGNKTRNIFRQMGWLAVAAGVCFQLLTGGGFVEGSDSAICNLGLALRPKAALLSLRGDLPSSWESPQHCGPLAGCDEPLDGRFKQCWGFHESEKVTLADQNIELRRAIPTVVPIIEINPEPDTPLPVVDVDGPAIWRVIRGQKDHQGRWKLEPAKDLREVGELQQLGNSFIHGFQLAQFKELRDLHWTEHFVFPPFVGVNL